MLAATLAAAMSVPTASMAAPDDSYIIFLPTEDGVEYSYEEEHMSEDYSTSDYTVLLYKPGESVSFQVTSEKDFTVEDALQGTAFADAAILDNGSVSFVMPDLDLCCDFSQDEDETETETEEDSEAETEGDQEDSGNTENSSNGTFRIKLGRGLSGTCTMVGSAEVGIETGGEYKGSDMVDLIHVTAEDGLDESPTVRVYKNGEKVEDTSDIVINQGLSGGTFILDFKNGLSLESDSYLIRITKVKGSETGQESEPETENEAETAQDVTETEPGTVSEPEPESEPESEPETQGTSEAEEAETEPLNAYFNPADTAANTATEVEDHAESIPSETDAVVADDAAGNDQPETEEPATETMSDVGTIGNDYEEDGAVPSMATGFADTVRETAGTVNITVTSNIPDLPMIIRKADNSVEAVSDPSYVTEDSIAEIEFIGDMPYAPRIAVLKNGVEMEDGDSIVAEHECLGNGNLFLELKDAAEILPGNYEIQIG